MEIELIIGFLVASIFLTFMPGPDNIFVITESITRGQKYGITISLGLVSGVMIHTLIATTGLSIIIQKSDLFFQVVKYLGAAYLFYLAYLASKEKKISVDVNQDIDFTDDRIMFSFWGLYRKGFFMNVLNPKVSLFFIAFLPQFISKESAFNVSFQMIILGLIFMIQALFIFTLISIIAGKLTNYLNSSKFWKTTKIVKIVVLMILGLFLIISEK